MRKSTKRLTICVLIVSVCCSTMAGPLTQTAQAGDPFTNPYTFADLDALAEQYTKMARAAREAANGSSPSYALSYGEMKQHLAQMRDEFTRRGVKAPTIGPRITKNIKAAENLPIKADRTQKIPTKGRAPGSGNLLAGGRNVPVPTRRQQLVRWVGDLPIVKRGGALVRRIGSHPFFRRFLGPAGIMLSLGTIANAEPNEQNHVIAEETGGAVPGVGLLLGPILGWLVPLEEPSSEQHVSGGEITPELVAEASRRARRAERRASEEAPRRAGSTSSVSDFYSALPSHDEPADFQSMLPFGGRGGAASDFGGPSITPQRHFNPKDGLAKSAHVGPDVSVFKSTPQVITTAKPAVRDRHYETARTLVAQQEVQKIAKRLQQVAAAKPKPQPTRTQAAAPQPARQTYTTTNRTYTTRTYPTRTYSQPTYTHQTRTYPTRSYSSYPSYTYRSPSHGYGYSSQKAVAAVNLGLNIARAATSRSYGGYRRSSYGYGGHGRVIRGRH